MAVACRFVFYGTDPVFFLYGWDGGVLINLFIIIICSWYGEGLLFHFFCFKILLVIKLNEKRDCIL